MKGLFLCILITIIGISTVWASDGNLKISDNSSTSQEIVMASGQQVLPNNGPYMGHGYILGSPINLGDTGLFFPTYEVQINQGRFTDDKTYIGSTVQLSIDDRNQDILNKFKEIEERNHELFVFEYYHKSSWNFEIENTQLFLINIYTLAEFIEHM
ncbi:MAG: hypothetical protein KDD40_11755, partial [Bdellovibrionales bacterium]|nr:hypothetical protein [Bdellovibrionales bacterium]